MQTYVGLRWLGTAEGSPVVRRLIVTLGLGPGVLVRTVVASGLVWVLWVGVRTSPGLQVVGLATVAGLHTWVVGANLRLMVQVV